MCDIMSLQQQVREMEVQLWEYALAADSVGFSKIISNQSVMVCGGWRCTGKEYAQVIGEFDLTGYEFLAYETVYTSDCVVQNHYVIRTKGKEESDFVGTFHVTTTWKKEDNEWKMAFNMDSRIIEE